MKLGVFNPVLYDKTLEETFEYLKDKNVQAIELGCGGYPGTKHLDAKEYIKDEQKIKELKKLSEKYDILISAISVHGNPVHPDKNIAKAFDEDIKAGIILAGKLGVTVVNTFSGCPGDCSSSKYPNWVTCAWPPDFAEVLKYQWEKVLIPYWKDCTAYANLKGINKIALELHPGFSVYNVESLLKLRNAVGETIGANLDPSHLIWQGVDMFEVIKALKEAIYHFHAKDTFIDRRNTDINGVLDTKPYSKEFDRSWYFRTVGYGNGELFWRKIFSALRLINYDYVVSIEHEDSLMTTYEGLDKAIEFLQKLMITEEKPQDIYWA